MNRVGRGPAGTRWLGIVLGLAVLVPVVGAQTSEPSQAPPALREAVRAVWGRNAAVQAAEARVEAAHARARAAAQPLYNPELELTAENADVDTRSVGVSQQIDWSGKRRARAAVADAQTRVAEAEHDEARQRVAVEWLRGYVASQVAAEQVALGRQRVELLAKFASIAQRRFREGDIPSLERDLAELALQEARAQQAELLATQAKARQMLVALGTSTAEPPPLPRAVPGAAIVPGQARLDLLPAIRRVAATAEAARERITVAERDRRADPTLTLAAGRVTSGPFSDRLIGATVRIPLFVRNTYRAEAQSARSSADAADLDLRDAQRRAAADVAQASESYEALRQAWVDWESSHAASAGNRAALLQRLWEAGELSTADYLVQLKQSLDTEITAVGLRAHVWDAWADWLGASGDLPVWLGVSEVDASTQELQE